MTLSEADVEHHCVSIYDADRDEEKTAAKPASLAEDKRCGEPPLAAEKLQTVHERLEVGRLLPIVRDLLFDFKETCEFWTPAWL